MIIWRGWGILAFLAFALGAALAGAVVGTAGTQTGGPLFFAIMLLVGGGASLGLGWWLNVTRPQAQAAQHADAVRAELWTRVRTGTFQVAPGAAAPRSQAEAQYQVEQLVAAQHERASRALRNNHTLFFIPIQLIGIGALAGGVVALVLSLV